MRILTRLRALLVLLGVFPFAVGAADETERERRVYKVVHDRELAVTVFRPKAGAESPAAIAFFHGGGWAFGSPEEFFAAAERYARLGMVCFVFEYRLSITEDGSFPHPDISPLESVKDARSAMRWLRSHARELGIDPDRIVAAGQSAGGQLALGTALFDGLDEATDDRSISPTPNALLLYSASVNTIEAWLEHLLGNRSERIWDLSPHHNLRAGMPPVLAFHGTADATVPFYTIEFFQGRMNALGNHYELVPLPGRDHYLGGDRESEYAGYFDEAILERTDRFLREQGMLP